MVFPVAKVVKLLGIRGIGVLSIAGFKKMPTQPALLSRESGLRLLGGGDNERRLT